MSGSKGGLKIYLAKTSTNHTPTRPHLTAAASHPPTRHTHTRLRLGQLALDVCQLLREVFDEPGPRLQQRRRSGEQERNTGGGLSSAH